MIFIKLLSPLGGDFPVYFEAVAALFQKINPYERLLSMPGPYNYPPSSFLFLWWLELFPLNTASVIWNILSVLSYITAIWILFKLITPKTNKILFTAATFAFTIPFFPEKFNIGNGQINNFILLFCVLGLLLYRQNRKVLSAILLAFAIGIKIVPAAYIFYFFLVKDYKQVLRILFCVAIVIVASFILVPREFQELYYTKVFFNAFPIEGKAVYYNQSLLGLFARAFHTEIFARISFYLTGLILILVTYLKSRGINDLRKLSAVTSLMLLLHPLSWQHFFVFSIIPLLFLSISIKKNKEGLKQFILIIVSYVLIAVDIKRPDLIYREFSFILSHQFFGVLMLWIVALWGQRSMRVIGIIWVIGVIMEYILILLCRGNICL